MKKIYIIILLFLITGCKAEYNLDIDKELNLNEKTTIIASTSQEQQRISDYNYHLPIDIKIDESNAFREKQKDLEYYEKKKESNNNILKFSYPYDIDKFNEGHVAKTCYQYVTVMKTKNKETENEQLLLSTSKEFKCFDIYDGLEEVTIKITSRYKLLETNADKSENYTYTWNINKLNYQDRAIYLLLDITDRDETWWEKFQKTGFYKYGIFIIIILLAFIIYKLFKKYSEMRDKI